MTQDELLRRHVLDLLDGKHAHVDFKRAVEKMPFELQGKNLEDAPHTPWQILEHMRIAQWDILEFTRNPEHISPPFPQGYWPRSAAPPDTTAWQKSVRAFRADLEAMKDLVRSPDTDLLAPLPHADGPTVLREAFLVADHNAYHLGQIVFLRRLLGTWKA